MTIKTKILLLRFSSIGDIILTTPVIRSLRTQLEDVEVHYCTKKQYEELLAYNPYIDKLHLLEGKLGPLIKKLRSENFDYIIDLHNNLRTKIIKLKLGVTSFSFNKLNFRKWMLVNLKINLLPNLHIVDRYMETVKPLGVKQDNIGLDYFIPDKDIVEREWLPETHRDSYVVYAIGGLHTTKRLPVKRMIELCDKINKPIILLGDKSDMATGQTIEHFFNHTAEAVDDAPIRDKLNKKTVIFNGCGKFNLNQSAFLIKRANYVFTHDTGLMHIAAAFKKKVFSIWGNTIPLFGMYPYRTKFTILENNNLRCRPCSKLGFDKCPKGHFKCMNDIVFDFYLP